MSDDLYLFCIHMHTLKTSHSLYLVELVILLFDIIEKVSLSNLVTGSLMNLSLPSLPPSLPPFPRSSLKPIVC